jgi:DNA adenine methylase
MTKPFLKWVGGKTQIIDKILQRVPCIIDDYHECFIGGGSVLFSILSAKNSGTITITGNVYAYDLNPKLINVYKSIQTDKDKLYAYIIKYMSIYETCVGTVINRKSQTIGDATTSKESYYYWLRQKYNKTSNIIKQSALFIILNKLCFRGVYREGPNGFNVPFGHYKTTPTIISKEHLDDINVLMANVIFRVCDFEDAFKSMLNKQNDFVYLDPPYAPETKLSFVGYTNDGFSLEKHKTLFKLIKSLECNYTMSNSNVKLVTDEFTDVTNTIDTIIARRAINSKNPDATTSEVIISNIRQIKSEI